MQAWAQVEMQQENNHAARQLFEVTFLCPGYFLWPSYTFILVFLYFLLLLTYIHSMGNLISNRISWYSDVGSLCPIMKSITSVNEVSWTVHVCHSCKHLQQNSDSCASTWFYDSLTPLFLNFHVMFILPSFQCRKQSKLVQRTGLPGVCGNYLKPILLHW